VIYPKLVDGSASITELRMLRAACNMLQDVDCCVEAAAELRRRVDSVPAPGR